MERPLYINWIVDEEGITFEDGKPLKCYKLSYENDEKVFDDWALHIRKHYIEDDELIEDSTITGLTQLSGWDISKIASQASLASSDKFWRRKYGA